MNLNGNEVSDASLKGRKQLLSELAEMSSKVSTLDGAVLMSFEGGKLKLCSYGIDPMELAETLEGIVHTIKENNSKEVSS